MPSTSDRPDPARLRDLIRRFTGDAAGIAELVGRECDPDTQVAFCEALLRACAHVAFADYDKATRVFAAAEAFGAHFLPCSPYSPIPSPSEIDTRIYERRYDVLPGLTIDRDAQLQLARTVAAYADEMDEPGAFEWNNPLFPPVDAMVLYGLLRHLRPRRVMEIGSGYATEVMARALGRNGSGHLICIGPNPPDSVRTLAATGTVELHTSRIQDVPVEAFRLLDAGDVLFIDSTHVAKAGSDVVHEIFQILPMLLPGVWIHFHDIFLPFDYPRHWIEERKVFWNEQYLLMAFLAFNDKFAIRMANFDLCGETQRPQVAPLFAASGQEFSVGSGLWIERI